MSENIQWFQTPIDDSNRPSSKAAARNWPFQMDVGQDVRIAFLNKDDDDIPPMHYHNVMHDGRLKRVGCTAADHLGGYCHLCEYTETQPDSEKWKTSCRPEYCYTILDDRYEEVDGEPKIPEKKLRLSSVTDHKAIKRIRETAVKKLEKDGICLTWIEVVRPKDKEKAPRIGILSQVLSDVDVASLDVDDDYLQPFTMDEILVQFVVDEAEIAEINAEYPLATKPQSKATIKEIED